jgi:serine/threonine protein kinase/WD40 repeat protein
MGQTNPTANAIYRKAVQCNSLQQRAAILDAECGPDAVLRAEVESLLRAGDAAGSIAKELTPGLEATQDHSTSRDAGQDVGTSVGLYKLLEQIGEGGMGVVYMADQQSPVRRRVALKLIKLGMDTKQVIARFEAERQALAMMEHPNIARVFDAGATESGRPYFVMELVKGVPVTTYCDSNRLTARERLELFVPICSSIQHAHQKGVIHRDIKPSNVLVTLHDGIPVPKVIDFGVAKATHGRLTDKTLFTEFRQMIGTPQYMSPEQAEMSGLDIDTRSDVYSLGVLLYELLTGTTPLDAGTLREKSYAEVQRIIRDVDPPSPSARLSTLGEELTEIASRRQTDPRQLGRTLRGELDWIVMKCLEKDRTRRYESASGLAADVQHYMANEPVTAARPSPVYRARKFIHRHRLQVVVASILLLSLIAGVAVSTIGFFRAILAESEVRRQKDALATERDRALRAEAEAESQTHKVEAQRKIAQAEARQAKLKYADSLISNADALLVAGETRPARARYASAESEIARQGGSFARLDLSLSRLYRFSPPPLWTANAAKDKSIAWTLLLKRRELLVADDEGKQFHVLDLFSGEELRAVGDASHVKHMESVETKDGPLVLACGKRFVRVLDPLTGAVLREIEDDRAMRLCALSPDGALAASVDEGESVNFWETADFKLLGSSDNRQGDVCALAFAHDGGTVASVDRRANVILWDAKTAREKGRFPANSASPPIESTHALAHMAVAFAHDDRSLFVGGSGGQIGHFSLDGKVLRINQIHKAAIASIIAVTDGSRLLTAGEDGTIFVLNEGADGNYFKSLMLEGEKSLNVSIAYAGDAAPKPREADAGAAAAAVVVGVDSANGRICAWPLLAPVALPQRFAKGLSVSPNGLLIAGFVPAAHGLEVRDLHTGRTLRRLATPNVVAATAFSPDSTRLYAGSWDGVLQCFDLLRDKSVWSVKAYDRGFDALDVSADGRLVASCAGKDVAHVWNAATGQLLRSLPAHPNGAWTLTFAPADHKYMVPAGDVSQEETIQPLLRGQRLIVGCHSGQGVICDWDLASTRPARRAGFPGDVSAVVVSPDRNLLAVVSNREFIFLLDPTSLKIVGAMGPLAKSLYQVRFIDAGDGPGQWLVSGRGNELRLWDIKAREEQFKFDVSPQPGHDHVVTSLDGSIIFSPASGRINLAAPRMARDLVRQPTIAARAAWCAEWGAWAWARELLVREQAAPRDPPAALVARAQWMCGDARAAQIAFRLAVVRGELPGWYADLCLSAADRPVVWTASAPAEKPAEVIFGAARANLPENVIAASDTTRLKALMDKEVTVQGDVVHSTWNKSGKHLFLEFGGSDPTGHLVCRISHKYRAEFDAVFSGDASSAFSGARVRIRGTVMEYDGSIPFMKGWPQIDVTDPSQVIILK